MKHDLQRRPEPHARPDSGGSRGRRVTIGCDVGGTSIQATLLCGRRAFGALEIPTPTERAPFLRALAETIGRLVDASSRETTGRPAAVGVGFCGILDRGRRSVCRSTHLPHMSGCRLADCLERRIGLPVILDTDTNAGAVSEATLGAGRRFSRVLYVSLGTGLGAALVVDRQPVRASHHTVGQISEIPLTDPTAGHRPARAESLLSSRGILLRARRRGLRRLASTADLFARARDGNREARGVWRDVGRILGRLLQPLACLWSPDVVVIAGGTAGAAEFFLADAERELDRSRPGHAHTPRLATPARGRITGAIGAALLAARE